MNDEFKIPLSVAISFLFLSLAGSVLALDIVNAEYYWDTDPGIGNGTAIPLEGANTDSAFSTVSLPTDGLPPGLHYLFIRYQDSEGMWTQRERTHVNIFQFPPQPAPFYEEGYITQAEYYFDNLPPVTIDLADSQTVSISELIETAGLDEGLHYLYVRYLDSRGIYTPALGRHFVIYTLPPQPAPFENNLIVGGEYWVNDDPGIGNGTPFEAADDGAWNESEEAATFIVGGLPLGTHYVGVRFYDELGLWTPAIEDTIYVGPVLIVRRAGNSIVLDWLPSHETAGRPFHIWRADNVNGPFAEVDTTSNLSWTDDGAVDSAVTRRFYHIRQTIE